MSEQASHMIAVPMTMSNGLQTRVLDSGGDKAALILVDGLAKFLGDLAACLSHLSRRFSRDCF